MNIDPNYSGPGYIVQICQVELGDHIHTTLAYYGKTAATDVGEFVGKACGTLPSMQSIRVDYYDDLILFDPEEIEDID